MKGDQMGTDPTNPSPRELPLSNQTRFKCETGEFLYGWERSQERCAGVSFEQVGAADIARDGAHVPHVLVAGHVHDARQLDLALGGCDEGPPVSPVLRSKEALWRAQGC